MWPRSSGFFQAHCTGMGSVSQGFDTLARWQQHESPEPSKALERAEAPVG